MQEQEIFQHYELKNWEFSPRIYKILAASAIFNIFIVVALAQANFLTAKSCDTPLMSGVCSVLDTLYVGSMILDTDTGYVNEDYVKTELEDADITFIDLSGQTPPLEYPAGYFALANPETVTDPTMIVSTEPGQTTNPSFESIPGIPNTKNPTITNNTPKTNTPFKPQAVPKYNPNATTGELPKGNKKNPTTTENQTTENQTTKDQTTAQQTDKQNQKLESESVKEVSINKKPMQEFADDVLVKRTKNEVDLTKNFLIEVEGYLTNDGRFDKTKSKVIRKEGDEQLREVAEQAVAAVGDSGWLGYLRNLGVEKVNFTLVQNDKEIYAILKSDQKTEERAKTISSGINGLILGAKMNSKDQSDEKILLSGAKVTAQGKSFLINFTIPKEIAQEMINRKLQEAQAKKNQSNTETQNDKSNQTAEK